MPRIQNALRYLLPFPRGTERKEHLLDNPLRWWNTHYQNSHSWRGGRIETVFEPKIKGFDKSTLVSFPCPHCRQTLRYEVSAVDKVKGEIRCMFCNGQFGMHPSGQLFVVRKIVTKVDDPEITKKNIERWVRDNTHGERANVVKSYTGITVELTNDAAKKFEAALNRSKIEHRRM